MKKPRFHFLAFLLGCSIVAACGPSQAEIDARASEAAANLFAIQTAQAPTITPTPSPTTPPTSTPSPTLTPTITPTPTLDLDTLYAGLWHRLNVDPASSTAQHQVYECEEGEGWTCVLSVQPEAELGFGASQDLGFFEGKVIPEWNCTSWLPEAICRSAIAVIGGASLFEGPGSSVRLDIEHIVVEIRGNQVLYEVLDDRFACPWFRSFDEALAANPVPYIIDCLQR